jgi:hypothetical protein
MFYRTECTGSERTCGGKRVRSVPEASPEANRPGRWDCAPSTAALAGKTAVAVATRNATASPVPSWRRDCRWGETKDTGCGERDAAERDRTLSCSCPTQKSKNFVSRARTTSLRCVALPRLGESSAWASPPPALAPGGIVRLPLGVFHFPVWIVATASLAPSPACVFGH